MNGVPQGSVLGPILFQIYISSVLKEIKNVYSAAYADDMCIACGGTTEHFIVTYLQRSLNTIHARICDLGLEFDLTGEDKTKVMWLTRSSTAVKHKEISLRFGNQRLAYTKQYKYLGVVLDNRLTFRSYIQKKLKEAAKRNAYVFRLQGVVKQVLRIFWRGYVESFLIYGLPWIYDLMAEGIKKQIVAFYYRSARKLAGLLPQCDGILSLKLAGIRSWDELLKERREGRKYSKVFKSESLDFPQSSNGRRCEIVFERWRTGVLYTNEWKLLHHFPDNDGVCRKCAESLETRQHILFDCPAVNYTSRQKYLCRTKILLKLEDLPETLEEVLGNSITHKRVLIKLGQALLSFCDDIDYWA